MVHDVQPTPGNAAGCAIIPQRTQDKGGFVRTGHFLNAVDPVIDVSVAGVRELLRVLGWPSPEEHQQLLEENEELAKEIAEARAELQEADKFAESIAGVARPGFEIRKVRGRPPQKKEEEVESAV